MVRIELEEAIAIMKKASALAVERFPGVAPRYEDIPEPMKASALQGVVGLVEAMQLLGYRIQKP